jgi:hypothetical protein
MHAALELLRTVDLGGRGHGGRVEAAQVQACTSVVNETKEALVPPVPLKLVPVQPVV